MTKTATAVEDQDAEICEVMSLVVDLATALGVQSIDQMPGAWEHKVDEHWWFASNGHAHAKVSSSPPGCMPVDLEPFQTAFWWHGWLAGLVTPFGGVIAAHPTGANEERLCADLRAAILRAGQVQR